MIGEMEPKIIFEDEDLMVLDKPAGMVVNRAETTKAGETVQEWVEKILPILPINTNTTNDFYKRAGIVHRLDKETSGLLLVAKTPEAFENLQRQFKERKVEKKYLALVEGEVRPKEGEINAPVGRLPWDREKFGVFPGGREAKTKYRVLKSYVVCSVPYALLEVTPTTGRTHQIRVHLKYLGFPIVGDAAYAGRKQARAQRRWCPRMFLHASFLKFRHPKTGDFKIFESQLPEDLKKCLTLFSK